MINFMVTGRQKTDGDFEYQGRARMASRTDVWRAKGFRTLCMIGTQTNKPRGAERLKKGRLLKTKAGRNLAGWQ
jgi:hypothetical protein